MSEPRAKLPTPVVGTPGGESVAVHVEAPPETPSSVQAQTATESETTLRTSGQRRINLVWELTQSVVAISVTGCTLFVAARLALQEDGETAAFLLLSNVLFLVLGTYHSRTNHSKIGGVGRDQEGR